MSDQSREEEFAEHIKTYAALFGFDQRHIVVQFDPNLAMHARAWSHPSYPYSEFTVGPVIPDMPFEDIECTAAHEAIHVVTYDLREWMYQTVRRYLSKKDAKVLLDQFERYDERQTEVLARGIVAARRGESNPGRIVVRVKPEEIPR